MNSASKLTKELLFGMQAAYSRGGNVMALAREAAVTAENSSSATLVAYDLQAGSYVKRVASDPSGNDRWCQQLAQLLQPWMRENSSLLEVGCGEATTLAGVLESVAVAPTRALGFDLSWSRCAVGLDWLASRHLQATLFVADLFSIPLAAGAVDVIYTSHSLEPNGGRERDALGELLRVARRAVVLVEPIYELADAESQQRMRNHSYVRDLRATAELLGGRVADYRLVPYSPNPLNPSGVIAIEKTEVGQPRELDAGTGAIAWRCPFSHSPMEWYGDAFFCKRAGLAYPSLRGIPLLTSEQAVVASRFGDALAANQVIQ